MCRTVHPPVVVVRYLRVKNTTDIISAFSFLRLEIRRMSEGQQTFKPSPEIQDRQVDYVALFDVGLLAFGPGWWP